MEPCQLTATEAAGLMRACNLSCEELVRSCLANIAARDPLVRAWLYVDTDRIVRNARELDRRAAAGEAKGALHGLPWGVKDISDTSDQPTTLNSPIYPGSQPGRDAACVGIVRHSGGLILGKTDTVEFASGGRKALPRNPFNPVHTPGGSSSGSGRRSATSRFRWRSGLRQAARISGRQRSTASTASSRRGVRYPAKGSACHR